MAISFEHLQADPFSLPAGTLPAEESINGATLGPTSQVVDAQTEGAQPTQVRGSNGQMVLVWWVALVALLIASHVLTLRVQG